MQRRQSVHIDCISFALWESITNPAETESRFPLLAVPLHEAEPEPESVAVSVSASQTVV